MPKPPKPDDPPVEETDLDVVCREYNITDEADKQSVNLSAAARELAARRLRKRQQQEDAEREEQEREAKSKDKSGYRIL